MRGRVVAGLLVLALLWLVNQGIVAAEDDAFDAVRLRIADLGHDPAAYVLLELDSAYLALGREVTATYVRADGQGAPLTVRARRRLAFTGWTLHELAVEAPR